MYCPRCAVHNGDDAKFCRSCGADISLVPDAVYGQLSERLAAAEGGMHQPRRDRHGRPPSLDKAVRSAFMGVAFILVAFAVAFWARGGSNWWFWMFIPAFAMLGNGVAEYMRVREDRQRLAPPSFVPAQGAVPARPRASELPPRNTGEMVKPPSVTEGTTRHLGVPVERQPKDVEPERFR
ncbi:MAG: zinc ribbon domain-containing protein [Acidobacteria bacterium]|nr:zinc ribbon domain-containing protein [Acidobacteriota bacterium]